MTFQDIFKSSFLENISAVSVLDMTLALILAFALGLFIFLIYKKSYCGLMYSAAFGVTLITLTLITALLMLAVTSNIVLSLGMVGALSIVRFRTAIKEPMDIAFLFWSIAAGIVLAAGFIPLAVFGSVFIGLVLLVFAGRKNLERPYILVVHCQTDSQEKEVEAYIKDQVKALSLKSKTVTPGCIELNYEVRFREGGSEFVNAVAGMEGVTHTVLVSYNGDYMG
ncbi:MAG TPA: DUF4956 domain-containing protein [Candidatus Mediterraneibacter tabaqchaliae]|uniref:DUF4956 domain-containing protein n=1 Tax=Candidatus Mediterraneibacter tabaqchaliae TaxID=2838689 RepID=A0A9D2U1X2_9FIRM|nr:DUF4956 domain-containing protein [Candidatus Mediterraneibacter tabaqchaliae]